jgi:hypothetical protein
MLTRPRTDTVPVVFREFCTVYLTLTEAQITTWWTALMRARWSAAVSLKQTVRYQHAEPFSRPWLEHFARVNLHPTVLVEALEALAGEGIMSRGQANTFEEAILSRMTAAGDWIG